MQAMMVPSASSPHDISPLHISASLSTPTPRSTLAATYATYVVRVHTRHGIKTISFDTLAAFFTFTAKKAAEDLGISSRTLIRVCRSLGIRRWPYLGFRSEKNVERIRQEAIENLRHKLERESSESGSSSPFTPSNSSCLRGASAKRLLQVNYPPMNARRLRWGLPEHSTYGFSRDQSALNPHCINTVVSPSATSFDQAYGLSNVTPPPTQHVIDLGLSSSVSPRRPGAHHSLGWHRLRHRHFNSSPSLPPMPSLSVLMEASVLTAFRDEVGSHLAQPGHALAKQECETKHSRTMSMRDILSNSTMTV